MLAGSNYQHPAILRPADLQRRWGVSKATVARWRSEGVLPPAIRLSAHAIGWRLEAILAFEESRLHAPAPCQPAA
jgi:predicted DNA-binding transcriptional regulator AlpA